MGEITEKCFICSKLGPNLSENSGSHYICKDTESKDLLASKKEASFSFACGTPRGE